MECRVCPKCGRRVYSANPNSWKCPYFDCEFSAITAEHTVKWSVVKMEGGESDERRRHLDI